MDREECELEFKAELHWLVECVGSCRLLGQELERMGKDWGELDAHPEFSTMVRDLDFLANKYSVVLDDEQLGWIMFVMNRYVDEDDFQMLKVYEEELEMARLVISLHSSSRLKVGDVECVYYNKHLKMLLLEELAIRVATAYRFCCNQCREKLLEKIKAGDELVLNEINDNWEERLRKQKIHTKDSNRIKELARGLCLALCPNYFNDKKGMSKKNVCFIYDLLVYCGARQDNGFTADDDKYDALKRFFRKKQMEGGWWFED